MSVTEPPAQKVVSPPAVIVAAGKVLIVPFTATFKVVAPVETRLISPDGVPVAVLLVLT